MPVERPDVETRIAALVDACAGRLSKLIREGQATDEAIRGELARLVHEVDNVRRVEKFLKG